MIKFFYSIAAFPYRALDFVITFCFEKSPKFKNVYLESIKYAAISLSILFFIPVILLFFRQDFVFIYFVLMVLSSYFNDQLKNI